MPWSACVPRCAVAPSPPHLPVCPSHLAHPLHTHPTPSPPPAAWFLPGQTRHSTALHIAAWQGHTEAARLILAHHAEYPSLHPSLGTLFDPRLATDSAGHTPRALARMRGHVAVMGLLDPAFNLRWAPWEGVGRVVGVPCTFGLDLGRGWGGGLCLASGFLLMSCGRCCMPSFQPTSS